ncbi:hypothetical protein Tco_1490263 [Tanacetum coccineum]
MFYQKNVDYVALLWEDFMFQADNKVISPTRKENMPYPRFTKVIINHFISKYKTIYMRNRINLYTVRDDTLLGTLKFVSKTEDYQKYGALIPEEMINQAIKDSKAYKTYLDFATGKATPKKARKFKKIASPSQKLTTVLDEEPAKKPKRAKKPEPAKQAETTKNTALAKKSSTMQTAGVVIRDTPGMSVSKKKAQAKDDRGKGMDLLFDVALLEAAQLKKVLKKTKQDTHMLHVSGSSNGFGSQPKVPDELKEKIICTKEETSTIPGVPDVPKDQSESENESWGDSGDNDDSNDDDSNDDVSNDEDVLESDDDHEEADDERIESDDEEEAQVDEYVHTPEDYVHTEDETNDEYKEFDEEEYKELYGDVNISLKDIKPADKEKGDVEMTNTETGDAELMKVN